MESVRFIRIAHALPGRLRLRLSWLTDAGDATALADRLAMLGGMVRVSVRPRTGSVLCEYDATELDEEGILAAVRRETRVTRVLSGDEPPPGAGRPAVAIPSRGSVTRSLTEIFGDWNQALLQTTEGRLDLGTATALGLLTVGLAEVLTLQRVQAPPWFNLAWWAFRTMTIFDDDPPRTSVASP